MSTCVFCDGFANVGRCGVKHEGICGCTCHLGEAIALPSAKNPSQDAPQSTIPDGLTPAPMAERTPFYGDCAYEIALCHMSLSDVLALKLAHDAVRALK